MRVLLLECVSTVYYTGRQIALQAFLEEATSILLGVFKSVARENRQIEGP